MVVAGTAASTGLISTYVTSFANSGTNLFAGTGCGVFHSTNNGTNWTAVNNGLSDLSINALAVSGNKIFVIGVKKTRVVSLYISILNFSFVENNNIISDEIS